MENSTDLKVIGALLALALAVGGAGMAFPRLEMLLQIASLAAAAYLLVTRRRWRLPGLSLLAVTVLGCILLLPLLQIVPLPPAFWTHLPGRTLAAQVDAVLGWSRWRPLTLDVGATARSSLTLLAPAVIFAGSLFLRRSERIRLLWVVLAFALVSAVMGIVQLATGGWLTPYPSGHLGYSIGLFVNRNHQAALLLTAIPVAAAIAAGQIARKKPQIPWIIAAVSAILIFAVAALGTTSRMGLVLLPLSVAAALVLLLYRRTASRIALGAVVGLGVVTSLIFTSGGFDRTIARFAELDDTRLAYWTDIQWALDFYGLAGTGFGTFVPLFQSAESLEAVIPQVVNHAHNDYLELLLEGGIPALLLFLSFTAVLAVALVSSIRRISRADSALAIGAAAVAIGLLLAWSTVDYPLRMPALASVFALFCAMLLPSHSLRRAPVSHAASSHRAPPAASTASKRLMLPYRLAASAALGLLLVVVVQSGVSAHLMSEGRYSAAVSLAPWSTQAQERLATQALLRNDISTARSRAYAAVALSPISVPAIRTLGLVSLARGAVARGNALMQVAVGLGWRDPLTQLWAIHAAKASGEPEKALQRAQALLQQGTLVPVATTEMLDGGPSSQMIPLLAQNLAQRPPWREPFFEGAAKLAPGDAGAWVQLAERLEQSRAPMSLSEASPALGALLAAGKTEEAHRLWEVLHGRNLVSNGDFEDVVFRRGTAYPRYWDIPRNDQSDISIGSSGFAQSRALHIGGSPRPTIARQTLMLRPGTYDFSYRALAADRAQTLQWELRCVGSGDRQTVTIKAPPGQRWQNFRATFTVPSRDCPIQKLALKRPGMTDSDDVSIDEIRLERSAG